jgi:hypothetical protein
MSTWPSLKEQNPFVTEIINKNKGKQFPSPPSDSWLKELKKMDMKRLNSNANWLSPKKSKSKKGGAKNKRSQKTKTRNFRKTRHRSRV